MAIRYKKINCTKYGTLKNIYKWDDKDASVQPLSIPLNEKNTDYLEYLEWVKDGGVPEESD